MTIPTSQESDISISKSKFQPHLGARITSIRILRRMTYDDLAVACDVTERTIKRWERDWVEPEDASEERLKKVSEAFGLDPRSLTQPTDGFLIMLHVAKTTQFGKRQPK